ncbi:LOW QUALITY PROTEIN: alpha-2-macroglobulin receptor-associated protein-like [Paramacrobiotus metropolitanus]|uniref:LOW QUALITY PROTEIN: alpha-2-macroglobulin receptor-associated protein-like n=1 Tax=Paramacrobiotus metropolitanus TaxID=2943436 RepID=UPI002445FFF3|nr:LOW QUALITY PROTEIN: alpha-2-macroglobulin receptor-associated protein-like [Paramacrobiotus metropolitanus]
MRNFVLIAILCFSCFPSGVLVLAGGGGKYSKDKNQKRDSDDAAEEKRISGKSATPTKAAEEDSSADGKRPNGPFRIARLNAVWEKAQRRLSADDLRSLLDELQLQDKDEITLKRLHMGKKDKQDASGKEKAAPKRFTFKDKKLNKLWEKAQRAGFSDEELQNLKTEFIHHQQKVDDYYEKFDEAISGNEKKPESDNEDGDYQIKDQWNDLTSELTESELEDQVPMPSATPKEETVELDKKLKDLTKNYGNLKERVNRHTQDLSEFNFKEDRVEELWNQAVGAGFDREELLSLRNELQHFEKKLQKLKNFNDEIQTGNGKKHPSALGKGGEKSQERLDLESKAKHFAQKTEKLETEIQRRIENRRNEL